ncbi:MAG: bifunctional UDP-N-acetylmuramoyl-tripeptide:D-alanyl-D-alanine ligase/alanine racemase, partial [Muribaculaceae bacterium]|nr:bifunctional UDP-N-acetylmuramoyl-tripeptide:D-alanyl-D-alanine ligase/alanine racemase [Muribaculaceae bacterium]
MGKSPERTITSLLTDSRDLTYPESTAFFALRTAVNDGHRYIAPLYRLGVRCFVVDKGSMCDESLFPEALFIKTDNTLEALQILAAHVRKQAHCPVIGITGSRGKTIVKELLYKALHENYSTVRSPRSYNSQIGVPLSLWELSASTQAAIFEAGISRPGEMAKLHKMIQPTVGIFTSLTDEHQDGFGSLEQKATEKALLFIGCRKVIVPADGENALIISEAVK